MVSKGVSKIIKKCGYLPVDYLKKKSTINKVSWIDQWPKSQLITKNKIVEFKTWRSVKNILATSDSSQILRLFDKNIPMTKAQYLKDIKSKYQIKLVDPLGLSAINKASCHQVLNLDLLRNCDQSILPDHSNQNSTWYHLLPAKDFPSLAGKTGTNTSLSQANFVGCTKEKDGISRFGFFMKSNEKFYKLNQTQKIKLAYKEILKKFLN